MVSYIISSNFNIVSAFGNFLLHKLNSCQETIKGGKFSREKTIRGNTEYIIGLCLFDINKLNATQINFMNNQANWPKPDQISNSAK